MWFLTYHVTEGRVVFYVYIRYGVISEVCALYRCLVIRKIWFNIYIHFWLTSAHTHTTVRYSSKFIICYL